MKDNEGIKGKPLQIKQLCERCGQMKDATKFALVTFPDEHQERWCLDCCKEEDIEMQQGL